MKIAWSAVSVAGIVCLFFLFVAYFFPLLPNAKNSNFLWTFSDAGIRSSDHAPLVSVVLETPTTLYPSGVYPGKCTDITDRLPNELSGVLCWWLRSGVEIGVFQDAGAKEIIAIEHSGDIYPGYRDGFRMQVLFDLNTNE